MKRLLTLVAALIVTIAALGTGHPVVQDVHANSTQPYIRIYENGNGTGDSFAFKTYIPYVQGYADLTKLTTGLTTDGFCSGAYTHLDWDDCISSFRVYGAGSTACVAFYDLPNYQVSSARGGTPLKYWLNNYSEGALISISLNWNAWNDTISSMKWATGTSATNCFSKL